LSHEFKIKPVLAKKLEKLFKKDKNTYEKVLKKIDEIVSSKIRHFKNLRYNMKKSKRTHIGHFFLVFSYHASKDFIVFEDFDHHDKIYRK